MEDDFSLSENAQSRITTEPPVQTFSTPPSPTPQPPPPSQQTLTCEICLEPVDEEYPTRIFDTKCGPHPFCNLCVAKHIQARLDDNVPRIPCPALNCSEFLDPEDSRSLIAPKLFVRWCDSLCEFAFKDAEKTYCPNRNCSALILNECRDRDLKRVTCPGCKLPFCYRCKLPWHGGFRCGELRDENDRTLGALAERMKWMSCPNCHHFVELCRGCAVITCRCGFKFCYRCGKPVPRNRSFCQDCDQNLIRSVHRCCFCFFVGLLVCFFVGVTIFALMI